MEKKKKSKKIYINLLIFILLIIFTFSLVLKDQDVTEILKISATVKKQYIFIAMFAMGVFIACESINIGRILKELGEKSKFISNVRYTLIGFFFSAITPAASGGQPMEIYYMHKDNISVAHSTLALLMQLCSIQIVTITVGIISAVLHFEVLKSGLIYLLIQGLQMWKEELSRNSFVIIGFFIVVIIYQMITYLAIYNAKKETKALLEKINKNGK